jgi:endonuclease/exonuclease/phosphatase family metal-dependent hydrolase
MQLTIGTFNVNNLFSRYNFQGEISAIESGDTAVDSDIRYQFGIYDVFRLRTYQGKLVKAKDAPSTAAIAARIKTMNVDVLAVQEVEDIDTLRVFNRDQLGSLYPHLALVEGNDPRLIDVAVLSKLPLGAVVSWQHAVHTADPSQTVFSRDLLQVEILNASRSKVLLTVFNTHLKSHFVEFPIDPVAGAAGNNLRRQRQAEVMSRIIRAQMRPDSRFAIVGDMNDPPTSPHLSGFIADAELALADGLANPTETRPAKADNPPPPGPAWTHRFKESGSAAHYELFDHIWLSQSLAPKQTGAFIDRRTKHGGDGSDHDPAWVAMEI